MFDMMATTFDWRESAVTNLEKLSTAIAKASIYSIQFHNNIKGLVNTFNVAYDAQQTWGSNLTGAQRKIKVKYLFNKVHDADSIVEMTKYLPAADEQQNCQNASAP